MLDQGTREETPEGVCVGTAVRRKFPGYGWYDGVVCRARSAGASVEYEVEWEDGSRASSRETHRSTQHHTPEARARVRARAARVAASEVQGGSCAQVSPASTPLLRDNSPVAFIAEIDSMVTRHIER